MDLGPIVKREMIRLIRRGKAWRGRTSLVIFVGLIIALIFTVWDWFGYDRISVRGANAFALKTFGLIVGALVVSVFGGIPTLLAPMIAGERDRKTLDALLAAPFRPSEIVLGTLGAGLLMYFDSMLAVVPVIMLVMIAGGIDPLLILLSFLGLFSMGFFLACLSTWVSVHARTAVYARSITVALSIAWTGPPFVGIVLLPRLWPVIASWVVPILLSILDSSPMGIMLSVAGMLPRGPLAESLIRMIAYQLTAGIILIIWATIRLRPASRSIYDVAGSSTLRRILRGRWRPRPPVGDDALIWRERYSTRAFTAPMTLIDRLANLVLIGLAAYAVAIFAIPAIGEVFDYGYGPSRTNPGVLEMGPWVHLIIAKFGRVSTTINPGHARLAFNVAMRQTLPCAHFVYFLMIAGTAAESIPSERERDTWLGLIVTPLSGWEIIRAKLFGAFWKTRVIGFSILAILTTALLSGALHPLGYIAEVAVLAASVWFFSAFGVAMSVSAADRGQANNRVLLPVLFSFGLGLLPLGLPGLVGVTCAIPSMPFQTYATMLSYDDIYLLQHGQSPPEFASVGVVTTRNALIVVGCALISISLHITLAYVITRRAIRTFDATIGRPVRPRNSETSQWRARLGWSTIVKSPK